MASTADQIIRVLLQQARCADFDCAYRAEDVHVLRQRSDRVWDLAAVCNGCYTMSLIRAIVQAPESARVPSRQRPVLATAELTRAERRHFDALDPIDADDVLDLHAFLSGFDGDFRGLFGRDGDEP
ncbi:MAG: hypothetical protein KDH92_14875 [Chloroflexi bacterium]|nr:hypothetical protein [Chloroflexota bacterium]